MILSLNMQWNMPHFVLFISLHYLIWLELSLSVCGLWTDALLVNVGMVLKVRTPLPIDNNLFNVEGRLADRLRMGVCLEGG